MVFAKWKIAIVIVGVILISVGVVLHFTPSWAMQSSLPLVASPQSKTFPTWKEVSIPIYIKFFFFNITNLDELVNGADPHVEEVGPYVYNEVRVRDNLNFNHNLSEITFTERVYYNFDQKASGDRTEDDIITNMNIEMMTVFDQLVSILETVDPRYRGMAYSLFSGLGARHIHDTHTVNGLLWGYNSTFLLDVKQSLSDLGRDMPTIDVSHAISLLKTTMVGLLLNRNGTGSEAATVFTVGTGLNDLNDLAKIRFFNGQTKLDLWGSNSANKINGTDGSIFHPGITKDATLYMFAQDICRSIYATFTEEETLEGIQTLKFSPPEEVFQDIEENPSNIAFCQPNFQIDSCLASGLLSISSCRQGAPIVVSQPHLYQADKRIQDSVIGVNPDPTKHVTMLNVEPTTGAVIQAQKRLQFNIVLSNHTGILDVTKKMKHKAIVPLMWLEEGFSAKSAEGLTTMLKDQLALLSILNIVMYVCLVCGSLLFVIGLMLLAFHQHVRKTEVFNLSLKSLNRGQVNKGLSEDGL